MKVVLGIDPGRSGAATALRLERGKKGRGIVADHMDWKESTRGGIRGYKVIGGWFKTIAGLAEYMIQEWLGSEEMGEFEIVAVAIEGMVIDKKKSMKGLITLIEETGAMVDAVKSEGLKVDYRPTAPKWRGRVLHIGSHTRRDVAEKYAMECKGRLFGEASGLHSVHDVESACIAMYAREVYLTGNL